MDGRLNDGISGPETSTLPVAQTGG
jgi:hypothetical protein